MIYNLFSGTGKNSTPISQLILMLVVPLVTGAFNVILSYPNRGAHTHDRVTFGRVPQTELLMTDSLLTQWYLRPSITLGRVPLTKYF
jgi:hypothetical protein